MAGLKPIHLKVIRTLLRNRRNSATLNEAWRHIHETLEVGEPRGNSLHFDAAMLRILRREAERESGAENLLAYEPSGNRLQAARQGLIDEKVAPQRPDDGFVLVKGRLPAPLPGLTPELSLRVPLASLDLAAIGSVVVVENLDSFDDWHAYPAPAELADSLVLYRGHGGLARGARRLLAALPGAARVTAFADWDPAGLEIAMTLPGVGALLVPVLDEILLARGSRAHFDRQSKALRYLEGAELGGWSAVWEEMKAARVSLKQQHMLAHGAALQRVMRSL